LALLNVFGTSGLLISGVFFLVRLQVFYFVSLIVRIIAVIVVLALPWVITDGSPRNDIIYRYWILTR